MCVCMFVCVRMRERNSERVRVTEREIETSKRVALKSAFVFLCKKKGSYNL